MLPGSSYSRLFSPPTPRPAKPNQVTLFYKQDEQKRRCNKPLPGMQHIIQYKITPPPHLASSLYCSYCNYILFQWAHLLVNILGTGGYMMEGLLGRKDGVLSSRQNIVFKNICFQPKLSLVLNIVSYGEQINIIL